jgi:hypothetical protein
MAAVQKQFGTVVRHEEVRHALSIPADSVWHNEKAARMLEWNPGDTTYSSRQENHRGQGDKTVIDAADVADLHACSKKDQKTAKLVKAAIASVPVIMSFRCTALHCKHKGFLSEDGLLKHIVAKRGSVDKEESEEHHVVELPNSGYGNATAAVAEAGDLFAVSLAGLDTLLAGNNECAIAAKPPKKQKKRKAEEDRLTQYTFCLHTIITPLFGHK